MSFFGFTPLESKAIIFLGVVLLLGSGVTLHKKYNPDFAPELLLKEERKTNLPKKNPVILEEKNLKVNEGKINLNTADLKELESLPGIGKELAQRILDYRLEQQGFSRIEELKKVKGIGPKTFEKIKNLVRID